jgi:hypothetical protein
MDVSNSAMATNTETRLIGQSLLLLQACRHAP